MSTITTINATDQPKNSRAVINTNFSNLNNDKVEASSGTLTAPTINTSIAGSAIATGAEVTTGTDDTQIVTPKALGDAGVNTRLKSKMITATRNATSATGNVSYTGVGFAPTALVVYYQVGGTTVGGWGSADSAKAQMTSFSGSAGNFSGSDSMIILADIAGGADQEGTLSSYDSDGFTIAWVKNGSPTGTITMYFTCYR